MNRLFILLFLNICVLNGWAQQQSNDLYTISGNDIQTKGEFIVTQELGGYSNIKPYTLKGEFTFDNDYHVRFYNYKNWDDEAGDYEVVEINYAGNQILEFINESSWKNTPKKYLEYSVLDNKNALFFSLENNVKAIILIGHSYACDPPVLTIIVIKDKKAQVVFNQPWKIEDFKSYPKGFELTVIDEVKVVGDDNWNPNRLKIYTTSDGTMKFEKVN